MRNYHLRTWSIYSTILKSNTVSFSLKCVPLIQLYIILNITLLKTEKGPFESFRQPKDNTII